MIAYSIELRCASGDSAVIRKTDLDRAIDDAFAYWRTGVFSRVALLQGDQVIWQMTPETPPLAAVMI